MKRRNGFTLIELLAVIVILAIIAVIAVPIVINIIDDSKKNASLRSADFYLDAVEISIADRVMHHGGIKNGTYNILESGNVCLENYELKEEKYVCSNKDENLDNNELVVEVNGEHPKEGTITIIGGEILHSEIKLNEKEIIKDSKGEIAYAKTLEEVCTYVEEENNKEPKTAGAKYICKVDPNKDPYTFYVLTTPTADDTRINLIMDQNINSDGTPAGMNGVQQSENENQYSIVEWLNEADYGTLHPYKEGICDYEEGCVFNDKGPLTAMNFLQEATKAWTNINEMVVDTFTDDTGAIHNMKVYNTYARMPYFSEVGNPNENNNYLYKNLDSECKNPPYGYWLLTSTTSDSPAEAWSVTYEETLLEGSVSAISSIYWTHNGVRPVINLKI